MATTESAKQGVKTLAAQLRGVFAGLEDFPTWAEDLEAREAALATASSALPALAKERDALTAEIAALTSRRVGEVTKSTQAAEQAVADVKASSYAELTALAARLDAAREQAEKVERESAARIAEATAKAAVAEAALAETTRQYEAVQKALDAIRQKIA